MRVIDFVYFYLLRSACRPEAFRVLDAVGYTANYQDSNIHWYGECYA